LTSLYWRSPGVGEEGVDRGPETEDGGEMLSVAVYFYQLYRDLRSSLTRIEFPGGEVFTQLLTSGLNELGVLENFSYLL
jgi:hypothetical protein